MFSKGDNFLKFLFTYQEDEVFQKWGLLIKERICSEESKLFSLGVDPYQDGRQKMEIKELLPIKVFPFTLKMTITTALHQDFCEMFHNVYYLQ